jgi:hypothetical protein
MSQPTTPLTPTDIVRVANVAPGRYSVVVVRPAGAAPEVTVTHAAQFRSFKAALSLAAKVSKARRIDLTRWLPLAPAYTVDQ